MRLKHTFILFVVALLLLGYFFLIEQPRHRRALLEEQQSASLINLDPGDVHFVRVVRPDVTLEFAREKDGWKMTSPIRDAADQVAVNMLVVAVARAEVGRDLGPETDLAPFGLDVPAVEIELTSAAGDTIIALHVGKYTVDKSHIYARMTPGGSVLLLPTGIRRYTLIDVSDFRDQRVFDFELANVASFTVTTSALSTSWYRTPENEWATTNDGVTITGRKTDVEALLRRLRGLRVKAFVSPQEQAEYKPFDAPVRSIKVFMANGDSTRTLVAGKRYKNGVCARVLDEERVVVADTTLLGVFTKTVFDLRDRRLLKFNRRDVAKISVMAPNFQVTLVKLGNQWGYPNPSLGNMDQSAVAGVLTSLQQLKFGRVLVEEPREDVSLYRLSNPDITLTISDEAGRETDQLICRLSDRDDGAYIVTSRSSQLIAELNGDTVADLLVSLQKLRQP